MNVALTGKISATLLLLLIFAKILATSVSLGGGGSGGIFALSLFIGAMTGAFFGTCVHNLFPTVTAGPCAYALAAMGGTCGRHYPGADNSHPDHFQADKRLQYHSPFDGILPD